MQVIVKFVCVQVRIIDGVFRVLSKTILERFFLLCNLISCVSVCHSRLRQNECCSEVIVLVSVYCLCLVVLIFHRFFLYSFEIFFGTYEFSSVVE